MKGLLGRDGLPADEGLFIAGCDSIHTWFMRFTIDVVFLDRDLRVARVAQRLRPWCLASCSTAGHVLELPAGAAAAAGIREDLRVKLVP